MGKNILIFSDGTGQAGGRRPDQCLSNVYKLFRATRVGPDSSIDPAKQVAFYDPGLGTTTEAGFVHFDIWDRIKAAAGAAAGLGISENVADCYEAILKLYEPGDRIYLFGFSRGAYTARSVAGVLNLCGVPTQDGNGKPLPRSGRALRAIADEAVRKVYDHGAGHPREQYEDEREEQARRFRLKYGSGNDEHRGTVYPYFIGVFDAVAALGIPPLVRGLAFLALGATAAFVAWIAGAVANTYATLPAATVFWSVLLGLGAVAGGLFVKSTFKFIRGFPKPGSLRFHFARWNKCHYDAYLDPRVDIVRHALSIDETRRDFARVEWGPKGYHLRQKTAEQLEQFEQVWFAGNHSDIGGSYPENESRLSDISLNWMVGEATDNQYPILTDPTELNVFPDYSGEQHCEVRSFKDKMYWRWWPWKWSWPELIRHIPDEAPLHPSVVRRFELETILDCGGWAAYRPAALRNHKVVAHFYDD